MADEQPDYFNMTPEEREAALEANSTNYLAGLQKQAGLYDTAATNAQAGVGALDRKEQGALGDVRSNAGRAFAAQNAQGGGGSMAGMRQSALSSGIAEGQVRGDFGMQRIAAQRLADQAATTAQGAHNEVTQENTKMLGAAQEKTRNEATELANARDDIQKQFHNATSDTLVWEDEDRKKLAAKVRAQYRNYPNQKVREEAEIAAQDIENNSGTFSD